MTAIVTWNIQWGQGCDGKVDLARIARVVESMGGGDLLCFQEVSRFDAEIDGAGADQAAVLAGLFPGHAAVFGAAVDRNGGQGGERRQFGNLILTRLPVRQVFRHPLPQPAAPGIKHMPRQATEVVVDLPFGPLRLVTAHLEYHAAHHRAAQIAHLRGLHAEVAANAAQPAMPVANGPYASYPRPASLVACGDFNLGPEDAEYRTLFAPFPDRTPPFRDGWRSFHGQKPHPPSTGLFDRKQWPQGGHCRDYFVVTPDIAARIRDLTMNAETDASDHQPLRLVLAD